MNIGKVDATRKVTVSLGGACRLRCAHCYITAPQFHFQPRRSVDEVIRFLESQRGKFDAICISGDTDPLLDQPSFCDLLEECASKFPDAHLLFTTRLLPSEATLNRVGAVGAAVTSAGRLLVPAVSFLTYTYPNFIENERLVPTPQARIDLVGELADLGLPVLVAMRPTLPFEVVPRTEVEALVERLADAAAAILGEVFIVDAASALARRVGLQAPTGTLEPMTFLPQPGLWRRWRFQNEIDFVSRCALGHGVPFFLRSMSAVAYLEEQQRVPGSARRAAGPNVVGYFDDQDP